jgi:hypothetical protein
MPRAANDQAACFGKMSGAGDAGKEHENVGDALRQFAMEHLVWQGDRTMGCEFEMRILDQKGVAKQVLVEYELSEQSAIRSARKEAEWKPFEARLGDKRVYPRIMPEA